MSDQLLRALVTVAFGALAGGITNTIAIWMLFHPYEPPKVFGRAIEFLHGAVPKNQPRLAKAIGRTVGTRLLTEDDLTEILAEGEFRSAFDSSLAHFLENLLEVDRGTVRDLLPESVTEEAERLLEDIASRSADRLRNLVDSETFPAAVEARTDSLIDAVRDEPVGGILTPAREATLTQAVDTWLVDAVEAPGFRRAVEDYLGRMSERFLGPERTFEEILPAGLASSLEKAVAGYLPLVIQRLGTLLENPEARFRVQKTIHDLFQRFLRDLAFHQRVVARLVMTEENVDRVLDTIEREGAERLGEMLREPEVQDAMSKGVNQAFVDFMGRPVHAVLGSPGDPNVLDAIGTLTEWLMNMARDERSRAFLVERLHVALEKASSRNWGDVLSTLPQEKIVEWMVAAARSEEAERIYREAFARGARGLLDRPIGRPARWFPDASTPRLQTTLSEPLWEWLQGRVPVLVQRLDVARRVEDKVMAFPTRQMEEIVRRVTDRELKLIVKLGYVLGAVIGLGLVALDAFLPW